ncbi:pigment dispersing hormone II [Penaeus vannamei]|uniref:Pigment dispersing hormone II n=1 Tax=Penaeus vannamei TaxID=6689 RepID=A0A3R7P4V3_PENVA|nr:pigment dispersing hormone II [Penaeus vannamei]
MAPAQTQPESRGRSASRGRDRVGALRSHIKGRLPQDVSFCNAVVCGVGGDGRRGDRSTEGTFSFKVLATELAIEILQAAKGAHTGVVVGPHKRNSELINSLLGLPKFMIDAGRR